MTILKHYRFRITYLYSTKWSILALIKYWTVCEYWQSCNTSVVGNLKMRVSRKQSMPNFPKNEHFLPLDTQLKTYPKLRSYEFHLIYLVSLMSQLSAILNKYENITIYITKPWNVTMFVLYHLSKLKVFLMKKWTLCISVYLIHFWKF